MAGFIKGKTTTDWEEAFAYAIKHAGKRVVKDGSGSLCWVGPDGSVYTDSEPDPTAFSDSWFFLIQQE